MSQSGRHHNPIDSRCTILRCFECDSTKHLASSCPHRAEEANAVHITLFSTQPVDRQQNLLIESFGMGLLDSGCTKTVAGQLWIQEYVSTLSDVEKEMIKEEKVVHYLDLGMV